MRDWEVIRKICESLWDPEDLDCAEAEEYGFKDQIINLFTECYDAEGFLAWLAKNDCNPANHFREAEIVERSDYDSLEEWQSAQEDALFSNDEYICVRW